MLGLRVKKKEFEYDKENYQLIKITGSDHRKDFSVLTTVDVQPETSKNGRYFCLPYMKQAYEIEMQYDGRYNSDKILIDKSNIGTPIEIIFLAGIPGWLGKAYGWIGSFFLLMPILLCVHLVVLPFYMVRNVYRRYTKDVFRIVK